MVGEQLTRSRMRMRLLKVNAGSMCEAVIVGGELATLSLHWIGRRSYVCPGEDCPACMECGSRWAGFLPVMVAMGPGSPKGVCLLEVTAPAWGRFDGLVRMEALGELFGIRVSIMRRRVKESLLIDPLGREDLGTRKPVSAAVCYDALSTLYGLPWLRDGESIEAWSARAAVAAGHRIQVAVMREQG